MVAKLGKCVRDNQGIVHNKGEAVWIEEDPETHSVKTWMELGTHRVLVRARWLNERKALLSPGDIEGMKALAMASLSPEPTP